MIIEHRGLISKAPGCENLGPLSTLQTTNQKENIKTDFILFQANSRRLQSDTDKVGTRDSLQMLTGVKTWNLSQPRRY